MDQVLPGGRKDSVAAEFIEDDAIDFAPRFFIRGDDLDPELPLRFAVEGVPHDWQSPEHCYAFPDVISNRLGRQPQRPLRRHHSV
jgi:hypothetical protein